MTIDLDFIWCNGVNSDPTRKHEHPQYTIDNPPSTAQAYQYDKVCQDVWNICLSLPVWMSGCQDVLDDRDGVWSHGRTKRREVLFLQNNANVGTNRGGSHRPRQAGIQSYVRLGGRGRKSSSVELTQLVPTQITPDAGHRHPLCTPDAPKTHQWSDPESKSVIGVFPISTARRITTRYTSPPDSTPMRQVIVAEW